MELFDLTRRLGAWCSCVASRRARRPGPAGRRRWPRPGAYASLRSGRPWRVPPGHRGRVVPLESAFAPDCRQHRHVEQPTHRVPAALNEAASLPGAGLPSHRGESGEAAPCKRTDGTGPGESAQLRNMDDQSCGDDARDAGDGGQDLGLALHASSAWSRLRISASMRFSWHSVSYPRSGGANPR